MSPQPIVNGHSKAIDLMIAMKPQFDLIERKRQLLQQVQVIANTELIDWLEQTIGIAYAQVQARSYGRSA